MQRSLVLPGLIAGLAAGCSLSLPELEDAPDAGPPSADAGTPAEDAGPADTGAPAADAGAPRLDAGGLPTPAELAGRLEVSARAAMVPTVVASFLADVVVLPMMRDRLGFDPAEPPSPAVQDTVALDLSAAAAVCETLQRDGDVTRLEGGDACPAVISCGDTVVVWFGGAGCYMPSGKRVAGSIALVPLEVRSFELFLDVHIGHPEHYGVLHVAGATQIERGVDPVRTRLTFTTAQPLDVQVFGETRAQIGVHFAPLALDGNQMIFPLVMADSAFRADVGFEGCPTPVTFEISNCGGGRYPDRSSACSCPIHSPLDRMRIHGPLLGVCGEGGEQTLEVGLSAQCGAGIDGELSVGGCVGCNLTCRRDIDLSSVMDQLIGPVCEVAGSAPPQDLNVASGVVLSQVAMGSFEPLVGATVRVLTFDQMRPVVLAEADTAAEGAFEAFFPDQAGPTFFEGQAMGHLGLLGAVDGTAPLRIGLPLFPVTSFEAGFFAPLRLTRDPSAALVLVAVRADANVDVTGVGAQISADSDGAAVVTQDGAVVEGNHLLHGVGADDRIIAFLNVRASATGRTQVTPSLDAAGAQLQCAVNGPPAWPLIPGVITFVEMECR